MPTPAAVPTVPHWIAGRAVVPAGVETTPVTESATGREVARVPAGDGKAAVGDAVAAAAAAFPGWRATSLSRRADVLFGYREQLRARADDLVDIIVCEHGKVADDARGEVTRGLDVVQFACGLPHLLKGEYSENVSTAVDSYSIRQPLGVMAGITPFNFPVMVPMWMYPVAIACGNAFVLKPSEKDPSAAVLLAQLFEEAGLPAGVLNVVQGGADAVNAILEAPEVAAVSFVGSTPVAEHVHRTASANGKRVQALGGAKNIMVVLPDADVDLAADALVSAAYGSAGERCMAISAVVAVAGAADPLVGAVTERLQRLPVGPGTDPDNHMGPLITAEHRDRVESYLDLGASEGARLVYDGRGHPVAGAHDGHWLGPSLLDHVTADMQVYRDEIFGPVLVVLRVETFEQALRLVNDNPWGNGTAVFTNDGAAARRFHSEVQVGMVGINVSIPVPMAYYSFGGWKASLFGDLHVHGRDGIHFATRGKVVTARWPESNRSATGQSLAFPT